MQAVRGHVGWLRSALAAALTLTGGALVLGGCDGPGAKLLHERAKFEGQIRIESSVSGIERSLSGELVFDRKVGHYEFVRRGEQTVSLKRVGNDAPIQKFVNGQPKGPLDPADIAAFQMVWSAITQKPGDAEVDQREDGYTLTLGQQTLNVTLEERDPNQH